MYAPTDLGHGPGCTADDRTAFDPTLSTGWRQIAELLHVPNAHQVESPPTQPHVRAETPAAVEVSL